jgi:CxxC motif-containing protein
MSEHRVSHYLCIGCPLGCRLEVEDDGTDIVEVRGWDCKRGERYGREEHTDPRRVVATTIGVRGALWARMPVKTSASVPKAMVREIAKAVRNVEVEAPVKLGTPVLANVLGTGVDIVATRDVKRV